MIRRTIAAIDANDGVVLYVIGELATDTAIRTHAVDRFIGDDLIRLFGRRQRTSGAGLHTFAAGHAGACSHRIIEIKDDFRLRATECVTDHIVHLFFAAGANATGALDAGVEIDRHRGMRKIRVRLQAWLETGAGDAKLFGPHRQFVGTRFVVFRRCIGGQKFQHHLLRGFRARRIGGNDHAVGGMAAAGWC